jgi:hypothetical protein
MLRLGRRLERRIHLIDAQLGLNRHFPQEGNKKAGDVLRMPQPLIIPSSRQPESVPACDAR